MHVARVAFPPHAGYPNLRLHVICRRGLENDKECRQEREGARRAHDSVEGKIFTPESRCTSSFCPKTNSFKELPYACPRQSFPWRTAWLVTRPVSTHALNIHKFTQTNTYTRLQYHIHFRPQSIIRPCHTQHAHAQPATAPASASCCTCLAHRLCSHCSLPTNLELKAPRSSTPALPARPPSQHRSSACMFLNFPTLLKRLGAVRS